MKRSPETQETRRTEGVRTRVRELFSLLRRLEAERTTGLVHVRGPGGERRGHIMMASGRVCFATPAEGSTPIGEWLSEEEPSFRSRLDIAITRAQASKRRLCESLLEDGELPLERLREALRRQIARGLLSLVHPETADELGLDCVPARDDYDRRLTFSALDVFVAVAALFDAGPVDEARRFFDEYVRYADAALLLTYGPDAALPLPLAAHGMEELCLTDVVALARTAVGILRQPALASLGVGPRLVVLSGSQGLWVCGRGRSRLVFVRTGPDCAAGQIVGLALRLWGNSG